MQPLAIGFTRGKIGGVAAPPSDHPTRTLLPGEPPPADGHRTATLAPPNIESIHVTRAFEGPDSPTSFPTPDDRYVQQEFIARGGMGEVWSAWDRVLNRVVAMKVLREDLKDRKSVASRFVEEARISGKLEHPGIPPIHDLGTLRDGRPFIAMKLIRGGRTLSDRLVNDPPELPELLRIFDHVCQAVASAHDRRVIHRDLKPGNVMVGRFNEVQVMDWGLAKALGESPTPIPDSKPTSEQPTAPPVSIIESDRDPSSHTRAGSLLGTPAYMPPEQAKGEVDRTDTRSDVFSLGAMLCELLTGNPPYWAATAAEIQALAITAQLAPAYGRLDACNADAELVALAKRCLNANPDDRPFDAKQVANAIAEYRAGVEDRLRRAERDRAAAEAKAAEEVNTRREAEARAQEHRKRRRVQAALAAAAVVLLLGAGVGAWWADRQAAEKDRIERDKQAEVDRAEAARKADQLREASERNQRFTRNAEAVETLLGQVEAALAADDAEKAAIPFGQIEKRLADGGVDSLLPRVERSRQDLAMLRDLDRTDDLLWSAEDYKLRRLRSTQGWEEAFHRYGIDPGSTPTEAAVRRIGESKIRERLLLALDLWWLNYTGNRRQAALRTLLQAADPDPFRNEVRQSLERADAGLYRALMDAPEMLKQPPRFAAVIGQSHHFSAAGRERILRPALERNPNDFALILTMSVVYESEKEFRLETATQQLRWAQSAVSVRPGSKLAWRNLGRANWDRGQIDDAVRCYKRAVRLDVNDYNSWTQLSAVLLRKHDPEAAKEAVERAIALSPEFAMAHSTLGSVFDRMGRRQEALREFDRAIEIESKSGYESSHYFNNRGYTRLQLGDLNGAIGDFQNALRIQSDFKLAETNLSYARELRKNGRMLEEAPPPREKSP